MKKLAMHPMSVAIQTLIEGQKGYSLKRLLKDLGVEQAQPEDIVNYLKESTICDRLDIPRGTFHKMKSKGLLKQYFLDGNPNIIRYIESEVLALMKEEKN